MNNSDLFRPDPIRVESNPFAHDTMSARVPRIVREIQAMNPDYSPVIMENLDRLHTALTTNQPIRMLDSYPVPAPDYPDWAGAYHIQQENASPLTWLRAEWFFAETFVYRQVIQAVRWFETGRDPFVIKKQEELGSERFQWLLDRALDVQGAPADRLAVLLGFALWGNRVDLSHPSGQQAADAVRADDLLVDERGAVLSYLLSGGQPVVHIVADNAGTELTMDLVLADALLEYGAQVTLHLKWHPTFVSDAIVPDFWNITHTLERFGGQAHALALRLRHAWNTDRLALAPHPFWNSCRFLWELPRPLLDLFRAARLVILKGDANYRRAVGDAIWPVATPFPAVMSYFPAPVLVLRTLKSDPVVGLAVEVAQRLDTADSLWRVSGQYGMIQWAAPAGLEQR